MLIIVCRYLLGITAKKEMVHCTAKDLIGKFVGETEDKVRAKLQEARGGVLLIDEVWTLCPWLIICSLPFQQAYNLCGLYGKDAQVRCVNALTAAAHSRRSPCSLALNDLAGHVGWQAVGA